MPSLTSEQIALIRLRTQNLVGRGYRDPTETVTGMLAMQAQDFGAARWAIGTRTRDCALHDITAALDKGEIVRSWPMRGTLHFTTPRDLRLMLSLTAERTLRSFMTRRTQLGLDERSLGLAERATLDRLSGGRSASRQELFAAFESAGVMTNEQRGYHTILYLAQRGIICLGPLHGAKQDFVLLDEWAPATELPEREGVLTELIRRYFVSHGPATIQDFCWWSKLTVRDAKVGLAEARRELVETSLDDGRRYWMSVSAFEDLDSGFEAERNAVLALPAFDEHLLGYRDRSQVLEPEHFKSIVPVSNGMFLPTIVASGAVVGTWRRRKHKSGIAIEVSPFTTLSDAVNADVRLAIGRYQAFVGSSTTTITVIGEDR